MRKTTLTDSVLCKTVEEMERGLIDADLGGGLVKKRVALPRRGKMGGARTLIVTNKSDRCFFVFGFEKNEMESIEPAELNALKAYAPVLIKLSPSQLIRDIDHGSLQEICHD